jgi:sugar lactone lactonase YvrE
MKRALISVLAAVSLASCAPLDQEAMVLAVDPGWAAEIVAGNSDGVTSPDGLHWRDGGLWIADEGGSAVRSWAPGSKTRTLADKRSGLASPEDLALDQAGNVYFSDDSRGGVWRTGLDGRTRAVASPQAGLSSTEALALTPSGDLLVGDPPNRRVMKVAPSGAVSIFLGPERGITKPESFAFDGRGNLYIADNEDDVLYLLSADGKLHRTLAGLKGFSPESLHFAGGTLFITDSRHGKLFRYTPEDGLSVVAVLAGRFRNVQGIASDERGSLYLSVQSDLKAGEGYILRLYPRPARA